MGSTRISVGNTLLKGVKVSKFSKNTPGKENK